MNRNRRPMPNKNRKALEKEIKKGQKQLSEKEDLPRSDTLTPSDALKKYPTKCRKMEKPLMDAVVRKMSIKKKKKETKHSKRVSPGDVEHRESAPAHVHTENERWQKALQVQSKTKRKILTSKIQKKHKGRK